MIKIKSEKLGFTRVILKLHHYHLFLFCGGVVIWWMILKICIGQPYKMNYRNEDSNYVALTYIISGLSDSLRKL